MAANAGLITYSFGAGDIGLSSIVKTVDGVTLTATNFSPTTLSLTDGDGLCFAGNSATNSFCPDLNSLTLSFSSLVKLISYQVGFISPGNSGAVLLFSQGANSSSETSFVDEAISPFANQFTALG